MNHELWRYELRRIGWLALVGPPLALMGIGLLALVANQLGHADQVARILTTSLDVLPLVGGVAAATAVSADEALELQLSLPTTFRTTIIRRLALSLGWTGLLAFASTLALSVNGSLRGANSLLGDQLTWLAPLLWLVGVATALSLGLRAAVVGSGLIAVLWVVEQVLKDLFAAIPWLEPLWLFERWQPQQAMQWGFNRFVLLASAAALLGLAYWLLGRPERLLKGDN
ncbi:MAG: hypothetical protein DLM69_07465 [Candidatus Chloroheliales bacterium]|nr:MAG: hypothetical protein DLM69_07465 [Chloroflexota bacterium]